MKVGFRHIRCGWLFASAAITLFSGHPVPATPTQTPPDSSTAVLEVLPEGLDLEQRLAWLPNLWVARRGGYGQKRWLVADGILPITLAIDDLAFASPYLALTDLRDPDLEFALPATRKPLTTTALFQPAVAALQRAWQKPSKPRTRIFYGSGTNGLNSLRAQHAQSFSRKLSLWLEGGSRGYAGGQVQPEARGYLFQGRLQYLLSPRATFRLFSRKSMNEETVQAFPAGAPITRHDKVTTVRHLGQLLWTNPSGWSLDLSAGRVRETWEKRQLATGSVNLESFSLWTLQASAALHSWELRVSAAREDLAQADAAEQTIHEGKALFRRALRFNQTTAEVELGGSSVSPGGRSILANCRLVREWQKLTWEAGFAQQPFLTNPGLRWKVAALKAQIARRTSFWAQALHLGDHHEYGLRLTRAEYRRLPLPTRRSDGQLLVHFGNLGTNTISGWARLAMGYRWFVRLKSDVYTNPAPGYPQWTVITEAAGWDTLFSGDLKFQISVRFEAVSWRRTAIPVSETDFTSAPGPAPVFLQPSLVMLAQYRGAMLFFEARWAPPGHREALPGFEVEPLFLRWGVDVVLWD